MALVLQDYRDFVRFQFDVDDEDISDLLIDTWAREGQNRILSKRRDWPHLEANGTLALEVGVNAYTVPYRTISHLEHPTYGRLRHLTESEAEDYYFNTSVVTAPPQAYSLWAEQLTIYPYPNEAANLAVRGYRTANATWTSAGAGATPDLPETFHDVLLEWVLYKAYLHQDDPEVGGLHFQEYTQQLDQWIEELHSSGDDGPIILNRGSHRSLSDSGQGQEGMIFRAPWA